jgi:hypothetical protein
MMAVESMACGSRSSSSTNVSEVAVLLMSGVGPARVSIVSPRRWGESGRPQRKDQARGRAGRALVEERYDARRFAQRLSGLYRDVAARHAGRSQAR